MKNEIKKTIHCSTPAEKKALQSPIPVKKKKKKAMAQLKKVLIPV